jgi:hypothetical protein
MMGKRKDTTLSLVLSDTPFVGLSLSTGSSTGEKPRLGLKTTRLRQRETARKRKEREDEELKREIERSPFTHTSHTTLSLVVDVIRCAVGPTQSTGILRQSEDNQRKCDHHNMGWRSDHPWSVSRKRVRLGRVECHGGSPVGTTERSWQ